MKRVLISGSGGKIARALIPLLIDLNFEVIGLSSKNRLLSHNFRSIQFDWENPKQFEIPKIDWFLNFANMTSPYELKDNLIVGNSSNITSLLIILNAIKKSKSTPNVITLGSITEYGSDIIRITENLTPRPETFYEVFKLNNINIVNQALSEGWLANSIYLRLANIYGFQNSDEFSQRNFIDKSVRRVLNKENLVCYGDGNYLRDYLHVNDLTNLLIEIIENLQLEGSNIFNIGNYHSTTIYEALRIMANTSLRFHNFLPEIILTDFPSNSYKLEKRNHVISPSRILHICNWRPTIDLQTGLRLSMLKTNQELK